jgi:succinate dehydrogenase / fumarate reductase, membrane anchor subunit
MSLKSADSFRTPRARVEGLGAAHTGTMHFLRQRISAAALVALSIWFVFAALRLVGADLAQVLVFLGRPVNAVLMLLFLATALYHMALGLQIIVEDYVHQDGMKLILLVLIRFAMWGIGAAAGFALLRIAL